MSTELTPEFAETVSLPRNPLRRHSAVVSMLRDPEIIGDNVVRDTGTYPILVYGEHSAEPRVHLLGWAFLGRRTLKMIAQDFIELNNQGEQYGEDF